MILSELPLPPFYDPDKVGHIWRVPYEERAVQAVEWAKQYHIQPAARDQVKIAFVAIDVQIAFCIPGGELFVGGYSGLDAVADNHRLCSFLYRNIGRITHISATLDTHQALQIFHGIFFVNDQDQHPQPYSLITYEDIITGRWKFNPLVAESLHMDPAYVQQHLLHYTRSLKVSGKYDLTIWPYHVMLGGIGHAFVPAFEEAVFFHTIARDSQPDFVTKGQHPLTEHYSVIGPEVMDGPDGEPLATRNAKFIKMVEDYDIVIMTGQAKSHCLSWTVDDLLMDIQSSDPALAHKVYLLEDTTSPIVVPGVVDYGPEAAAAFHRFSQKGVHLVNTIEPMENWPGVREIIDQ